MVVSHNTLATEPKSPRWGKHSAPPPWANASRVNTGAVRNSWSFEPRLSRLWCTSRLCSSWGDQFAGNCNLKNDNRLTMSPFTDADAAVEDESLVSELAYMQCSVQDEQCKLEGDAHQIAYSKSFVYTSPQSCETSFNAGCEACEVLSSRSECRGTAANSYKPR